MTSTEKDLKLRLKPDFLWRKSPVRFTNYSRVANYIISKTRNNLRLRKKALQEWKKFSGKILVGTRSFQRTNRKKQFHYMYGNKNYMFQLDICDLFGEQRNRIAAYNNGAKYILVFINNLTKKVYAHPLENRKNENIKILRKILTEANIGCKHDEQEITNVQVDKEFLTSKIRNFFSENCINVYHSESDYKASLVERFIRSLKEGLVSRMEGNYTEKWTDLLKDYVTQYNTEIVHSSTNLTPQKAEELPSAALINLQENFYKKSKKMTTKNQKFKFEIGDLVRLKGNKDNNPFIKSYRRRFTTEVYKIYHRRKTPEINVYYVKSETGEVIKGAFREDFLRLANNENEVYAYRILKEKGDKVLISWDGYPSSSDEWIKKKDLAKLTIET